MQKLHAAALATRLATCLATCLALAGAPAMAQNPSPSRFWTGDALRYTPSTVEGCNVAVMEARTSGSHVIVTLRNGGTANLSFTLSGELAGGGQRSIGTVTARLPPGRNISVQVMPPYRGSLSDSILTLRGSACSVVS